MPRPMILLLSAILFIPLGTVLVTAQPSLAEPASDECKTKPGSSAPTGSHWYYLINRTDQRRCWFLGPKGAYVRSQARETASKVSSSTRTRPRENPVEAARTIPAPMEGAQRTFLDPASTELHRVAAADFAALSSDLAKNPDLDAREPMPISNNSTEPREQTEAREETPFKRPVLTEAKQAGLQDPGPAISPMAVFLVGALMVLLCAGVVFKLARRKTQPYRRDRRSVSSRPHRLHRGQKLRASMSETAARSNDFVRRSVSQARQRPSSVDPSRDIKASLRKIMQACERSWMTYSGSPHKVRRPASARAPQAAKWPQRCPAT
jgi:hypothetical protein